MKKISKKVSKNVSKNVSRKVSKKVLTILLLLCTLIFVGVLTSVHAAEGDGGTPEEIGTAAKFKTMTAKKAYKLTADIDLTSLTDYAPFDFIGELDGGNHVVTTSKPIFKTLNGKVSNLKIGADRAEGVTPGKVLITSDTYGKYCGCLACSAATTADTEIFNVTNNTDIQASYTEITAIAGLVGLGGEQNNATELAYTLKITDCVNNGTITGGKDSGGIVGIVEIAPPDDPAEVRLTLEKCINNADVFAHNRPGGVCGTISTSAKISGCENHGDVKSDGNYCGGVIGRTSDRNTERAQKKFVFTVTDCTNTGNVYSQGKEGAGICGYIGALKKISFAGCTNTGNITCNTDEDVTLKKNLYLGGISGRCYDSQGFDVTREISFENCTNTGIIGPSSKPSATVGSGGISAVLNLKKDQSGKMNVSFTGCKNSGKIYGYGSGKEGDSGGIVIAIQAYPGGNVTIRDCENTGDVLGYRPGGIVGRLESAARVINCVNDGIIKTTSNYPGGICARINGTGGNGDPIENDTCPDDEFLFLRCVNRGEVDVFKSEGGGIVGYGCSFKGVTFRNCCNFGKIHSTAPASLGGISGKIFAKPFGSGGNYDQYQRYIDCTNYGEIATAGMAGGISGESKAQVPTEYIRCGNTGKLTSGGDCGGISGYVYAASWWGPKVYCCFNRGDIKGNGDVSGLIGYMNCGYVPDFSHNYVAGTITNSQTYSEIEQNAANVAVTQGTKYKIKGYNRYFVAPQNGTVTVNTNGLTVTLLGDITDSNKAKRIANVTDVTENAQNGTEFECGHKEIYKFTAKNNTVYMFSCPFPADGGNKPKAVITDNTSADSGAAGVLPEVKIKLANKPSGYPDEKQVCVFKYNIEKPDGGTYYNKFTIDTSDKEFKTTALFWSNENCFIFDDASNIVAKKEDGNSIADADYVMGFAHKCCFLGGVHYGATERHANADFTDGTVLNALNNGIEKAFYQNPYTDTEAEKYPTTDKMHILPEIGSASGGTSGKVTWKYGNETLHEQAITEGADYRYKLYGPGDTKVFDHWEKSTSGNDVIFTAKDGIECEMQTVLGSEIVVKLRMGLPAYMCEDETAKMSFTIGNAPEGETPTPQELTLECAEREDGKYVFGRCEVPAKEMSDEIPVHVEFTAKKDWIGDEVIDPIQYPYNLSVKQYAKAIIDSTETEQKFKDAAVAMLNYGAAAQTYFGYKTSTLANAGLGEQQGLPEAITENPFVGHDMTVNTPDGFTGITFNGAALNLKSKTGIRYFFTLGEGETTDNYSFSYKKDGDTAEGTSVTAEERGEQWMVEIPGINASALSDEYVLTVTKGEQSMTIKYGPFAYFNRMWGKEEAASVAGRAEIPLGKAFWLYHKMANALLKQPQA